MTHRSVFLAMSARIKMPPTKSTKSGDLDPANSILGRCLTPLEQEFARSRSLESLDLSPRAYRVLKTLNCGTLFEIAICPMRTLELSKNVGKKTIGEIVSVVRKGSEDYSKFLAMKLVPQDVVEALNSAAVNRGVVAFESPALGVQLGFDVCLRGNLLPHEQSFSSSLGLGAMGLSTRAFNVLNSLGCKTLFEVSATTPMEIIRVNGSGRKTLKEIEARVRELFANQQQGLPDRLFLSPAIRKNEKQLREVYGLYEKHGTLDAVGRHIGLSRERVRQLLVRGTKAGLYTYNSKKRGPACDPQKLLDDYRRLGSVKRVAHENSLNHVHVVKALKQHGVTSDQMRFLRDEALREHCASDFKALAEKLGHFPNATELQRMAGRALYARIVNNWGSIDKLREHLNVPIPIKGNPRFAEDVRKWRSKKRRIQALALLGDSDAILECLRDAAGIDRPPEKAS